MKRQLLFTILLQVMSMPCALAQSALNREAFDLDEVTLTGGEMLRGMTLNDSVLLAYDADRLLQPFQREAGIRETGKPFVNWCNPKTGLDGHVGGHYVSALAISTAACHDKAERKRLRQRYDYMIGELAKCQQAWQADPVMRGYVGAVPQSKAMFTGLYNADFSVFNGGWVPWYNVHKIYAGLRDGWVYLHDKRAYRMFVALCDWGVRITDRLTDQQMQDMLGKEYGGMNEVYADAYALTGQEKYLRTARRFSQEVLAGAMAAHNESWLNNKHANTQIPKVIGFERIAQLDGDERYRQASLFFWESVAGHRSVAFGGNSVNEHFLAPQSHEKYIFDREGPETCNTYNMLKLSRCLFDDTHQSRYADFYERALFNHIRSAQHPRHGGYVYFTSARPRHYRVYSQVNQAMWCCVGTGMEDHGKYGEFIYSHRGDDSLFVNLFVPSRLDWRAQRTSVTQDTRFPYSQQSAITVSVRRPRTFTILVRRPAWCGGFGVAVNGQPADVTEANGYVAIRRQWRNGDRVTVSLPMNIHVEPLSHYEDYVALMYGPILLGAKTGTEHLDGLLAGEDRMGHNASGPYLSLTEAPILVGDRSQLPSMIEPVCPDSLTFRIRQDCYNVSRFAGLVLQPFSTIHDARYMIYWWQMPTASYRQMMAARAEEERRTVALDHRTIDYVAPGQQQSESDHFLQGERSRTGNYQNEFFRTTKGIGWFSYQMSTHGETDSVSLMLRYWGDERGSRTFHILVDGEEIATTTAANRWNWRAFVEEEYPIPARLLQGKRSITVRFQPEHRHAVGSIYYVRLLRRQ